MIALALAILEQRVQQVSQQCMDLSIEYDAFGRSRRIGYYVLISDECVWMDGRIEVCELM